MKYRFARTALAATLIALASGASGLAQKACVADVKFAIDALGKRCASVLKSKGINWKKATRDLKKAAKKAKTPQQHFEVLLQLVARLEDGHAFVELIDKNVEIEWPGPKDMTGPGMFWCRVDKRIYIKNAWGPADSAGLEAGMEIVKVDGDPVSKWLDQRVEELRRYRSFSTDHHAFFYATHRGLAAPAGTRMKLALRTVDGKSKTRTLTFKKKTSVIPNGPAYYPDGLELGKNVRWGRTAQGYGYIHIRRCKGSLPTEVDPALAALADAPGMILDFRGNSGGAFDHDALLGRFVPKGETMKFTKAIASAGPTPYAGPVIVIVDATAVSAGETASGMFKEDGRGYMIGESPTAGMSAQKDSIALPSGTFGISKFAVHSNKSRYQKGRGIEGVGIEPHEIVAFDPEDLSAKRDTLILRAEALFDDFPQKSVPYKHPGK